MTTLADFLLARIAEDEAAASLTVTEMNAGRIPGGIDGQAAAWIPPDEVRRGQWGRFRVLAECDAKRRIVEAHHAERLTEPDEDEVWTDCRDCWQAPPCLTLRILALPYAGHPDYDEGWRP